MSLADPAFRLIFEDAPVGIVVVDSRLQVVDVNAAYCAMLGYPRDELLRLRIPDVTHPEDRQRDLEFMPLLLGGQIPRYHAEKRYLTKAGQVVWASLTATALRDSGGSALYAFGMAQDITERKLLGQFVPLCGSCQRVRDPQGLWMDVGAYLKARVEAQVADEICPDCARRKRA